MAYVHGFFLRREPDPPRSWFGTQTQVCRKTYDHTAFDLYS